MNLLEHITDTCQNGHGFSFRQELEPLGGQGSKVFPPTYLGPKDSKGNSTAMYATETRVFDGEEVRCVLMDSVASSANRAELGLLSLADSGEIPVPVLQVVFPGMEGAPSRYTAFEASHRLFDAIFRDATLDGTLFRLSEPGMALTDASLADVSPVVRLAPHTLVFGGWDSYGPKSPELALKLERALVSEVIAVDARVGVKVSSRLSSLPIGPPENLRKTGDGKGDWDASSDATGAKVKMSETGHGNVAPTVDDMGGVTAAHYDHTATLSAGVIRKHGYGGHPGADEMRVATAALGVLSMFAGARAGYSFRSRCTLVPAAPAVLQTIGRDGRQTIDATFDDAVDAYRQAAENARVASDGIWNSDRIELVASPKVAELFAARGNKADKDGNLKKDDS